MRDQDVIAIKRSVEEDLGRIPGVHAVGVGAKLVAGHPSGEVAIQVFVLKKRPLSEIPPAEQVPDYIQGVRTDVIEEPLPEPYRLEGLIDSKKYRPLEGGAQIHTLKEVSGGIGEKKLSSEGTLGCIVKRNSDGAAFILTNKHVIDPSIDGKVYQPDAGNISICCTKYCCASNEVGDVEAEGDQIDAAIIKLNSNVEWKNSIIDIGTIQGTYDVTLADAVKGYVVRKRGRTTGVTVGMVTGLDKSSTYENGRRAYVSTMRIEPIDPPVFVEKGDSGSVVVDDKVRVVALLWGGSLGTGLATPIAPVTQQLNITILTGEQSGGRRLEVEGQDGRLDEQLLADLEQSQVGRELVGLYGEHHEEVRSLILRKRPVNVAWHRQQGPRILRAFLEGMLSPDTPMPTEIDGRDVRASLEHLEAAFLKHGSPKLRADILRRGPEVYSLVGLSYNQIRERIGRKPEPDGD